MKNLNLILFAVVMIALLSSSCGGSSNENRGSSNENGGSPKENKPSPNERIVSSSEVTIGKQIWMINNLNVDRFRNGDPIPEAKTDEEWVEAGKNRQPAWCYYNNNSDNGKPYGKLYNWFAVNDPRGLSPEGWKIPSDEDWKRIIDFLGGESFAGNKIKSADFWAYNDGDSGNGNNESGFSGLPAGYRNYDGTFDAIGESTYWWSSTEDDKLDAWARGLIYEYGGIDRAATKKGDGQSVRCLRN